MPTDPADQTSTRRWLLRVGRPLGIGAGVGVAGGILIGRATSVPGSTQFWDVAAQPTATVATGTAVLVAAYFAFHNGEETRTLESQLHHELMDRDRESNLQDRYTAAAKQLGDDNSAVREAGTYAIAALADDWLRYGDHTQEFGLAHTQARACVNLLCSYLRANRRQEFDRQFEREEAVVRSSVVGVLRERTDAWNKIEVAWISQKRLAENSRILIDLSGANLREENFSDANLQDSMLVDTDLFGANLQGTDLRSANLLRAQLGRARLFKANLQHAMLSEADFTESNSIGADFRDVQGYGTIFVDARFRSAKFDGANLRLADMTGVQVRGGTFAKANLWRANLSGAFLSNADFSESSRLEFAKFDDETVWTESTTWPEGFSPPAGAIRPPGVVRPHRRTKPVKVAQP